MEVEFSDDVATVTVRDNIIKDFPIFFQKCEEMKLFGTKGVFKGRIHSEENRPTSAAHLLSEIVSQIDSVQRFTVSHQHFDRHSQNHNIFTYRSVAVDKSSSEMAGFLEMLRNPSNFEHDQVTCCSQKLAEGGTESLLQHFWEVIGNVSIPAHNLTAEVSEDLLKDMVAAGERMKHLSVMSKPHPWHQVRKTISLKMDASNGFKKKVTKKRSKNRTRKMYGSVCNDSPKPQVGILYGAGIQVPKEKELNITDNFSLSELGTILDLHPDKYPGLSEPYYYVGTTHSCSALHVEDAGLPSVNFLHYGAPKIWIVVPPEYFFFLVKCLSASPLPALHKSCTNMLGHKVVVVDTAFLELHGIPYSVVVQHPGEFIFIAPHAAHFVFNSGRNLAVAVNFAAVSWILHGLYSPTCGCYGKDLIHLDMAPFLAMFYPHLLESYFARTLFGYSAPLDQQHYVSVLQLHNAKKQVSEDEERSPQRIGCDQSVTEELVEQSTTTVQNEASACHLDEACPSCPIEDSPSHLDEALIISCLLCSKSYKGSRAKQLKRLVNHCEKRHASVQNIVSRTMEKYPKPEGMMDKKLQCDICGNRFAGAPSNLLRHMKYKHST